MKFTLTASLLLLAVANAAPSITEAQMTPAQLAQLKMNQELEKAHHLMGEAGEKANANHTITVTTGSTEQQQNKTATVEQTEQETPTWQQVDLRDLMQFVQRVVRGGDSEDSEDAERKDGETETKTTVTVTATPVVEKKEEKKVEVEDDDEEEEDDDTNVDKDEQEGANFFANLIAQITKQAESVSTKTTEKPEAKDSHKQEAMQMVQNGNRIPIRINLDQAGTPRPQSSPFEFRRIEMSNRQQLPQGGEKMTLNEYLAKQKERDAQRQMFMQNHKQMQSQNMGQPRMVMMPRQAMNSPFGSSSGGPMFMRPQMMMQRQAMASPYGTPMMNRQFMPARQNRQSEDKHPQMRVMHIMRNPVNQNQTVADTAVSANQTETPQEPTGVKEVKVMNLADFFNMLSAQSEKVEAVEEKKTESTEKA